MPGDCAIGVKGICHSNELVGGYWLPWLGEHSCRPDQLPNAVSTPTCKGRLANTQHFGLNKGGSGNMVDRLRTLQTLESGMATVSGQNPDHSGDLDAQIAVSWFIFIFVCLWYGHTLNYSSVPDSTPQPARGCPSQDSPITTRARQFHWCGLRSSRRRNHCQGLRDVAAAVWNQGMILDPYYI